MTIRYHQRRDTLVPDYRCANENIQRTGPVCLHLPGHAIDQAISQLLLDTVTPLALEVALTVQTELEARASEADQLRRSHVDRARHNAELARRRYLAVDPDNRLVADTLEADWNDTLRALQAAQDEYDRQTAAAHAQLSEARKAQIRQLASDFPALWSDPATPARERKRIVRLLIEDVTLNKTDQIHLHVRFRGGQTTSLTIPIPLDAWKARKTDPDTFALLDRLLNDHTDSETAAQLNAAGRRSGTNKPFTRQIVLQIRNAHQLPSHQQRLRARGLLTIQETAQRLGVHVSTIKAWHRAGLLTSHKANDRNERLFDPPDPNDPRLKVRQGWPLHDRKPIEPSRRGAL
jgi:DNA-binding transcriptional regulator YiaG